MKPLFFYLISGLLCEAAFAQQQMTNSGNLRVHPGATMSVYGNFANNGTFTDAGQMITFSGTSNQAISGSAATTFSHCTVNNAAGVTLQRAVTISNTLTLTSGGLTLGTSTLTISNAAANAVTRTNGYIVSEQTNNSAKITWSIGTATGAHVFPFGSASGEYIPFTLNLTAGNIGNVTVSTYGTGMDNLPLPTTPQQVLNLTDQSGNNNSANTVDRFWQIDKDGPSGTANIIFTARATEVGSITNLKAQRWNSSIPSWELPSASQSSTATSVTVNGVTAFSPWTLTGNNSPLPIELLSFSATLEGKRVNLDWTTASELNNDYFTIEKTNDGVNFTTVAIVDGAGNSNQVLNYATVDPEPYYGLSYYRLKQTDFDGTFAYSQLEPIERLQANDVAISIYPNPTEGKFFVSLVTDIHDEFQLYIYDVNGKLHEAQKIYPEDATNYIAEMNREDALAPGLYTVVVMSDGIRDTKKVIVK